MDIVKYNRNVKSTPEYSRLTSDVYFLIQRFLSNGPLRRTLQTLNEELHQFQILPKRIDWEGNEHERSVDDMQKQYPFIRQDFLYYMCNQASLHLNENSNLLSSFLSFRPKAKTKDGVENNYRQYFNYVTKFHGAPMQNTNLSFNIVNSIRGREAGGTLSRHKTVTSKIYSGMQIQRLTIGHLSAVYCLLFDHSGRYIITGADDLLIKLWSTYTGRLIAAFRGASSEITDIAIDPENSLLAAGSLDRILRVWNLQNGAPIAVLTGHTGMITSVNFCPTSCWSNKYLISTSNDGSIAFWTYTSDGLDNKVEFRNTPTLYQEKIRPGQSQMICSSFSPGGTFLATGSADHHVRVYYMKGDEGPQRILETEAHTDRVDSIQWAHSGLKFLSGSKDGAAIIWWFERQQWKSMHLDMTAKLPSDKENAETDVKKIRVTMVAWDRSDSWVVTAVSDHSMKVWTAASGQLVKLLTGHTDEVYVLEPHPHDEGVILSAGHDGQLLIWDIHKGEILFKYLNTIEGQGYGAIFDAKWSPDGCTISASDSHGDILTFGFGTGSPFYQQLPKELFFHTDYRPLVRDQNYWVLDEQTQIPPHLMPPPFLVDIDGNPYPPMLQRLVPGRENCNVEQLVPNIVIGNEGIQEIIQDVSHRLLDDSEDEDVRGNAGGSLRSQRIRQSTGDWQTDHNIEWKKNVLVKPLSPSILNRANEIRKLTEDAEIKEYQKQLRKRPLMISTAGPSSAKTKDKKKRTTKASKRERTFVPIPDEDFERYDVEPCDVFSASEESSFSDWAEEVSESRKRRPKRRNNNTYNRSISSSDNEDDELTEDTDQSEEESDDTSDQDKLQPKPRNNKDNNRVAKEKPRKSSPKPSTSRQSGSHKASAPKSNIVPKKDPLPKTAQTAKLTAAEPSTSVVASTSKGPKIKVSEQYKLSEWLAETRPRKSPYYPQIYDEIVYFVQGHILYVEAVKLKTVYEPTIKELPWVKGMQLKDHEFCKVVGIRYEIKPPRLCCLKLALQDETGRLTGKTFTVRFHDMPDVLDFFVLKQCYITALSRDWQSGDRFRCMIDDNWWIGEIATKSPASDLYPESAFMCYEIRWTNGEQERMSPWDMEPIDMNRLPADEKAAIPVLPNELRSILYKSLPGDWLNCEPNTVCKSISKGVTQVMELAIAEPFLVPVDINVYPTYALIVEYPIDLSTIKARFENNFYRRSAAAQFDIRYLETNATKFNEQDSSIVRHAKILTELCLRIVKSGNDAIDIASIYHQLVDEYYSSNTEDEADVDIISLPTTSRSVRYLPVRSWKSPDDWKIEARGLLELMWQTEDSVPFRDPVNKHKYPTYHQIIQHPMDLSVVKDKLQKGAYSEPKDFCLDMRLIFQNSRTFNTNKRSRIYVMTVRLSAMFEEHIKKIISNWRITKKRQRRLATPSEDSDHTSDGGNFQKAEIQKVIDEPLKNGVIVDESDSDSDNTPLDVLKAMSRSNTATESDTTLDKGAPFVTGYEKVSPSDQEHRLNRNDHQFFPEASTSSQSIIDDFDHSYTTKRLSAVGYKPPSNKKKKDVGPDIDKPSTSNSRGGKTENNNFRPRKPLDEDSSDDEYKPPKQRSFENRPASSSDDEDSDNSTDPSNSRNGGVDNEYKPPLKRKPKSSSDSEEDDSLNLREVQIGLRKKKAISEDEDFCPEDTSSSSTSKRPPRRRRKESSDDDFGIKVKGVKNKRISHGRKRRPSFVVDDDDDVVSSEGSSSNLDSSDDDMPLRKAGLRQRRPKKNKIYMSSESDGDLNSRQPRKRRKVLISYDSDVDSRESRNMQGYFESVSSRGRVRKITERAAAFMKKDKKTG